jgi:hypothetical protein
MADDRRPFPRSTLTPVQAWLAGALAVGVLDGLDAVVFFGLRGVSPIRIFQGIAAGLLGRASFDGGAATVILGIALHFTIAAAVVATYHLASRRLPALARHPFVLGPLYGLVVFVVMNRVVIPLSAIGPRRMAGAPLINGLLIHAFGVGLFSALSAWAARPVEARAS